MSFMLRFDPGAELDPDKTTTHAISPEAFAAALTIVRSVWPHASGDEALRLIVREYHRVGLDHRASFGRTTGPGLLPYPIHGYEHIDLAQVYTRRVPGTLPTVDMFLEGRDEAIIFTAEGTDDLLPLEFWEELSPDDV